MKTLNWKTYFSLTLILTTLLLCSSCVLIFGRKKVMIKSPTEDAKLSAMSDNEYRPHYTFIGIDSGLYKSKVVFPLIIRQESPGYETSFHMYTPSIFNKWKILDLASTAAISVVNWQLLKNEDMRPLIYSTPAFLLYLHALLPIKAFPNRIDLPPMRKIPQRESNERYISVDKISMNLETDSMLFYSFKTTRRLIKQRPNHTNKGTESIIEEYSGFETYMNELLYDMGFVDTNLFRNSNNSVTIKTTILSLKTYSLYGFCGYATMTAQFDLSNANENIVLCSKTITGKSPYYFVSEKTSEKVILGDLLQNALYNFLDDSTVMPFYKMPEEETVDQQPAIFEDIKVNESEFASNKLQAIQAVVTIKRDNAHGSGCIVSKEGYIVTNYHVTGSDENLLTVVLASGLEVPCKLIRYNRTYDLALLKIEDAREIKPLKIITNQEISVGEEVFAIGTPADIDLGQTITKGIVSGKRTNVNLNYIQSDVSVNPGSSGGALINSNGELLGIINAKLFGTGVEGVAFAIPAYYIYEALKFSNN